MLGFVELGAAHGCLSNWGKTQKLLTIEARRTAAEGAEKSLTTIAGTVGKTFNRKGREGFAKFLKKDFLDGCPRWRL